MKKLIPGVVSLVVLLVQFVIAQPAAHIVISEVGPMGGASSAYNTGEFIELYNPFSVDVTFGPYVQIVSGAVPAGSNAAEWQTSLAGKTIKGYGFLLVGDGGQTSPAVDIAFPGNKNLSNSGVRSCVQLRDGATVIDAFAWDASTTLTGEGTKFTPSTTASDKKTFERKSGPSATSHSTTGNAWDSNDNATDFFQNTSSTANPQNSSSPIAINPYNNVPANGIGTASLLPGRWSSASPMTLTFTFSPAGDTVRGFKFTKPRPLSWNIASIIVQPNTIVLSQSGDTTILRNFILKGTDSIVVTIPNVSSVDTTNEFSFYVQSAKDSINFSPLQGQPKTLVYGAARPMSWVKAKDGAGNHLYIGKWVVVKGVVTVANEFGGPSYLQDATAGIAMYDSSVSQNVAEGDEILLLGIVSPYNDMFELNPCQLLQTVSQGNAVDTLVMSIVQIKAQNQNGVEPYECRLIRVNGINKVVTTTGSTATSWITTGSGTNYELISGIDTMEVRISTKANLANSSVPSSQFDIVGTLGQFTTYYQILPRSYNDIIVEGAGPHIISAAPFESNMTASGMKISWQTDSPGSSIVIRGLTATYSDTLVDTNRLINHELFMSGLLPATIYHIKIGSKNSAGTTYTNDYIVSTASQTSKGTMNVYFNHSVNTALAKGENAQVVDISSKVISRINTAKHSIDAALFSFSGTVGINVAAALVAAKNRGVQVRMIGEADNLSAGTPPWSAFNANGIPNILDTYDAVNAGAGLMHNKFFIIDLQDPASDTTSWVITGSWNSTDPGNIDDAQNVIEIQDRALANAYTIEFNEMWGGSTATPNAANSRFGARKLDNTPHNFIINDIPVESYFSPSDGISNKIIRTLNKATSTINFSLLTFTRSDIANVLIAKEKAGLRIHGVMSNSTDQGSVFNMLKSSGVDVYLKNNSDVSGFLHHKYGIVDAGTNASAQYVITGSHNWTSSAENANNENTLIINSPRLANLFLQEFSNRYTAAGGTDVLTGIEQISTELPKTFTMSQNYPNPFNPTTTFQFQMPLSGLVTVKVFDILGREVAILLNEVKSAGVYQITWNASILPSGVYFYQLHAGSFLEVKKAVLLK